MLTSMVCYLMDRGNIYLQPNVLDKDGCTPLFKACIRDE